MSGTIVQCVLDNWTLVCCGAAACVLLLRSLGVGVTSLVKRGEQLIDPSEVLLGDLRSLALGALGGVLCHAYEVLPSNCMR